MLLTFEVPEAILRRYIHPSLELDRWHGQTHVSLVAFDFEDTRVRGIRVPGLVEFPEVNLRTYVRHGERRGVVFIRELVGSWTVATVARLWYNEPYRTAPIHSRVQHHEDQLTVERRWHVGSSWHHVLVRGRSTSTLPSPGSEADYFKEHEWGFGRTRGGSLLTYRVEHPRWNVREIDVHSVEVDFALVYGGEWSFLNREEPVSRVWAVGSTVAVYPPRVSQTS